VEDVEFRGTIGKDGGRIRESRSRKGKVDSQTKDICTQSEDCRGKERRVLAVRASDQREARNKNTGHHGEGRGETLRPSRSLDVRSASKKKTGREGGVASPGSIRRKKTTHIDGGKALEGHTVLERSRA